jgi:hypothetical protein
MHNNIYASRKPKRNTIWNRRSRRKTYTSPLRGYMFDALINSSCTTTSTWRNIYDLYNSFFFFANATWIFSWYLFFFKRNVDLLMVRVRKYETNDRKHPQIIHRGVHVLIREHNLTPAVIWGVRLSRWGGRQCYQNGNCRRGHTLF